MESMSSYAANLFTKCVNLVDHINGMPPTVAIRQRVVVVQKSLPSDQ